MGRFCDDSPRSRSSPHPNLLTPDAGTLAEDAMATAKKKTTKKKVAKKTTKAKPPEEKKVDPREAARATIQQAFGSGAVISLDSKAVGNYDIVPTGSLKLNEALGVGGYPRGRIVELYGPESSGKTTLTLHAIAEAQKLGVPCGFVDAEHALDIAYARALGVDTDALDVSQPSCGEEALEIVDLMVKSGAYGIVVVDSVAALTPRAELEGEMGKSHVGLQARMMSQALRKLTANVSKSNTLVFFINQIRHKIGVMFGSPETTTGGNSLKFYASIRLDIRRRTAIKDGDDFLGNLTRVKVVKNKVAPPFREAHFNIRYGVGIDRFDELIEVGVERGVIDKAGAWLSFDGERLGQGKAKVADFLREQPELFAKIEAKVTEAAP